MRSMFGRGLRLELVAALGIAVAIPATGVSAEKRARHCHADHDDGGNPDRGGQHRDYPHIAVKSEDGLPASGAVVIKDHGKPLAGVALDAQGNGKATVQLAGGDHSLKAAYQGCHSPGFDFAGF